MPYIKIWKKINDIIKKKEKTKEDLKKKRFNNQIENIREPNIKNKNFKTIAVIRRWNILLFG